MSMLQETYSSCNPQVVLLAIVDIRRLPIVAGLVNSGCIIASDRN
jgi:hypothetical protein